MTWNCLNLSLLSSSWDCQIKYSAPSYIWIQVNIITQTYTRDSNLHQFSFSFIPQTPSVAGIRPGSFLKPEVCYMSGRGPECFCHICCFRRHVSCNWVESGGAHSLNQGLYWRPASQVVLSCWTCSTGSWYPSPLFAKSDHFSSCTGFVSEWNAFLLCPATLLVQENSCLFYKTSPWVQGFSMNLASCDFPTSGTYHTIVVYLSQRIHTFVRFQNI